MTTDSDPMDTKAPSGEQIKNLLRSFQPQPSSRLYRKMERAPWHQKTFLDLSHKWGFALLFLGCLLIASFVISPPLRAMARNWIMYFLPGQQDNMQVQLGDLSPQELYQYASPENFSYSIEQVSQQAGFAVTQLEISLPGLNLVGARFEQITNSVVLLYEGAGYNLFLSQYPVEAGKEFFSIGSSAVVEEVSIGDIRGEYVSGGWVNQPDLTPTSTETSQTLHVQWDPSLPQHTLRWEYGGFAYQLRSTGSASPDKSDLIALAITISS